jgi:hypothetical protein
MYLCHYHELPVHHVKALKKFEKQLHRCVGIYNRESQIDDETSFTTKHNITITLAYYIWDLMKELDLGTEAYLASEDMTVKCGFESKLHKMINLPEPCLDYQLMFFITDYLDKDTFNAHKQTYIKGIIRELRQQDDADTRLLYTLDRLDNYLLHVMCIDSLLMVAIGRDHISQSEFEALRDITNRYLLSIALTKES